MLEDNPLCLGCEQELIEPYINCLECSGQQTRFCITCFASGLQSNSHKNNHKYEVLTKDFTIFDGSNWSACEEENLLLAISELGLGNWVDIARQVQTKSADKCKSHYFHYYVDSPQHFLPEFLTPESEDIVFPAPTPFRQCERPIRPGLHSNLSWDMAGYTPSRADFSIEYDNYAELLVSDCSFKLKQSLEDSDDDHDLETAMNLAVVNIYNDKLRERFRRKKLMRDYGLLNVQKADSALVYRYGRTLSKLLIDRLKTFAKLMDPMDFAMFMERLHTEFDLQMRIQRLKEYRMNGVTRFACTKLYHKLKARRQLRKQRRRTLDDVLGCLKHVIVFENMDTGKFGGRKPAPPLQLHGLPGFESLNDREKELCSNVRLVPESYLEFKELLVGECQRSKCLKLAQARPLLKIDVNKTRRVYDFLVEEGLIWKDEKIVDSP